jgi:hypothetical protein
MELRPTRLSNIFTADRGSLGGKPDRPQASKVVKTALRHAWFDQRKSECGEKPFNASDGRLPPGRTAHPGGFSSAVHQSYHGGPANASAGAEMALLEAAFVRIADWGRGCKSDKAFAC